MTKQDIRLGVLYPGTGAEDDYKGFVDRTFPGTSVHMVCTQHWDSHTFEAMAFTGAIDNLIDGAIKLIPAAPHAVMWACTCASFVHGLDGAYAQAKAVADTVGVPAGSTSLAFLEAAHTLRVRRVAIAATYPADVAERFALFLHQGGLEVVGNTSLGIMSGREASRLAADHLGTLAERVNVSSAEAILVPDTAVPTYGVIALLERRLRKVVLTANQVTVWQGLRLAGCVWTDRAMDPELGSLFTTAALRA